MRVSRLYIPETLSPGQQLALADESAHYIRTVLRLKAGQNLILFNSQGGEYFCSLSEVSRKTVIVLAEKHIDRDVESPLQVRLGMGISRGDRMDWSVQKAVELGVNHITPLITERCVIKLNDDKKVQRWQHWQNIIQHAAEQSGRTQLPELGQIASLPDWTQSQQDLRIFLDPYATQSLHDLKPDHAKVTLLTGPEGGFSDQERQIALAAGFIAVRMGARILRTETAALTALAAVQTLWGDFR